MNRFCKPIIEPLVSAVMPKIIVGIGCAKDNDLQGLLRACGENVSKLHVVEPNLQFDSGKEHDSRLVYHRSSALNAIPKIFGIDLVIMDSEPNWHSVFYSLKLIDKSAQKNGRKFPCVLVHNVGWPYGRRDAYTDPETIPEAYRHPHQQKGVVPGENDLAETGGLFADRHHAIYQNELKNGVLTAVEDFQGEREKRLEWVTFPWPFGLGLLYPAELARSNPEFAAFVEALSVAPTVAALVEECEQARILAEVERQKLKAEMSVSLETYRVKMEELQKTTDEQITRLEEKACSAEKDESELRAKLEVLGAERRREQEGREKVEVELVDRSRKLEAMGEELGQAQTQLQSLRSRLEKKGEAERARADSAKWEQEARQLQARLKKFSGRLSKKEAEHRVCSARLGQLERVTESLSADIEKHLHSWTWKIGSGVLGSMRTILGRGRKPVEQLRIFQTLQAFRDWKAKKAY
jgi:hypothetical protein